MRQPPDGPAGDRLVDVLKQARQALAGAGVEDPAMEARLLVENVTGLERRDTIARPEQRLAGESINAVREALRRRIAGEPLHRIFGWREFYGLRLELSPGTLEPRPDTETLVEAAVDMIRAGPSGSRRVLDLGTGTGAVGLAIAAQVPDALVTGTDISLGALATAARNALALGLADRFRVIRSDWFAAVDGKFRGIVSNPPYIPSEEIDRLAPEVRLFDPRAALDGGSDGLAAYRAIATGAHGFLEANGFIAVEIGLGQCDEVTAIFSDAGFDVVDRHRDLGGRLRVLVLKGRCGA